MWSKHYEMWLPKWLKSQNDNYSGLYEECEVNISLSHPIPTQPNTGGRGRTSWFMFKVHILNQPRCSTFHKGRPSVACGKLIWRKSDATTQPLADFLTLQKTCWKEKTRLNNTLICVPHIPQNSWKPLFDQVSNYILCLLSTCILYYPEDYLWSRRVIYRSHPWSG